MFTVKSVSDEGEFYLVKNWRKAKAIWKHREIQPEYMYKTESAAKGSLSKLLKVMDEYKTDKFFIVETDENNRIISEKAYQIA